MRTLFWTLLTLLSAALVPAAAPTSAPATATTRTADMEPLVDGSLRYLPPPGWKLVSKSDDHLKASYATNDETGRIDIMVTPQTRDVDPSLAGQMAMVIGKAIRETD